MLFTFSSLENLDWQFRAKYNLAGDREWLRCNKQVCPITTSKKPCWLFSMSSRSRWGTSLNFNLFLSSCPVSCWHNWRKESRASLSSEIMLGGSSFSRKMFSGAAGRVLAYQSSSRFLLPVPDMKHRPQTKASSSAVGWSGESLCLLALEQWSLQEDILTTSGFSRAVLCYCHSCSSSEPSAAV